MDKDLQADNFDFIYKIYSIYRNWSTENFGICFGTIKSKYRSGKRKIIEITYMKLLFKNSYF